MSEWQPIETAPKDGTAIILSAYSGALDRMVSWDGRWSDWGGVWTHHGRISQPTHWMPLPTPPN